MLTLNPHPKQNSPCTVFSIVGDPNNDPNVVEEKPDNELTDNPENDPEKLTVAVPKKGLD